MFCKKKNSKCQSSKGPRGRRQNFVFIFPSSFQSCHPFVLLPLWERQREGGAADKNFCLPSDQPTILFFGDGNYSESVCKLFLASINRHLIGKVVFKWLQQDLRLMQLPCSCKHCFAMIFKWVIMSKQNMMLELYFAAKESRIKTNKQRF